MRDRDRTISKGHIVKTEPQATDLGRCLWAHTASEETPFPDIDGEVETDIAIVGAGYTGLSAAIHLAKAGQQVSVLEAHEPGYGASGRNAAGYLPFYLDRTPESVRRLFGENIGGNLNRMVAESGALMLQVMERYGIKADLRPGSLLLAAHDPRPKGQASITALREQWVASGQPVDLLGEEEMRELTGSRVFTRGLRFHYGGTLNPMSLCRGLARAAASERAHVFTRSAASSLTNVGDRWRIETNRGAVIARNVLLATDGYAVNSTLWPALEQTLYRIPAAIVASRPSPELARVLSPRGFAIADDYSLSHFWMMFDPEKRLVASMLPPRRDTSTAAEVAASFEAKLRRVYNHLPWGSMPQIEWEHFWLGTVAMTAARVPCAFRLAQRLHAIGGYSGQGITAAIGAGKEYAELIFSDGNEQACRLPFVEPKSVPLRNALPRLIRSVAAPLIRVTDRTYTQARADS